MAARPCACIRRLGGGRAGEMRFTRFLRNPAVNAAEIARHARTQTGERSAGRDIVVVQDTSALTLGGRRARDAGYGPVGKGGATRGLLLHAALALETGTGALLGLVDAQVWNRAEAAGPRRARATADKESQRWLETAAHAGEALAAARSVTIVSDRESDFYELFARRAPATLVRTGRWRAGPAPLTRCLR